MHPYGVPLCVPYWNGATYRGIVRSLLSGSVIDGPYLSSLRSLIIQEVAVEETILCGSGISALAVAIVISFDRHALFFSRKIQSPRNATDLNREELHPERADPERAC